MSVLASHDAEPSRSRIGRLLQSSAARLAFGTGLLAAAPALSGVLAARTLGAAGRGQLAVALALGSVAGSVGLRGLDTALLSASRDGCSDPVARAIVLRRSSRVVALEGAAAAVAVGLVLWRVDVVLFVTVALFGALTAGFLLARSANLAQGRSGHVLAADVASSLVLIGLAVVATALDLGVRAYLASAAIGLLAGVTIALGGLGRGWAASDEVAMTSGRLRTVATGAWIARTLQVAAFRLDRVVLAGIAGSTAAGVYAAVTPFAEMATIVPLHLAQLVTVRVARSERRLRWYEQRHVLVVLGMATGAAAVVVAAAGWIVDVVYGPAFADGVDALRILALASVISVVWRYAEAELFGRGRAHRAALATAVAAAIVLGGTAALSGLGAIGASIASLVGYAAGFVVVSATLRTERRA